MASRTIAVLERHLRLYRRLWRASALSFFLLPALSLLSMGLGVGGYVHTVAGHRYLGWIAPGLLVSTAFGIGVNESTFGVLSDFEWVGGLHAMRATPVRIADMIWGWLLYVLLVSELAIAAFMAVTWVFGALRPGMALVAPAVGGLVAVSVAAATTAFSATVRSQDWFMLLSRFIVLPMTLFSGVFFPIERLPVALRVLGYASPLWHGAEVLRAAGLGMRPALPIAAHLGYLVLCTVAGCLAAHRAFRRRLCQ